jgi:hypothetical protein
MRYETNFRRDIRACAIAGVSSVALAGVAVCIDEMWGWPSTRTTSAELLQFASSNRSALMTATILTAVAVSLWLVFGAGVWAYLRRSAPEEVIRSTCFGVGLVAYVTLLLAGFTMFFVLLYRAPSPRDALLLYDLAFGLLAMSGLPTAISLWAYASIVFRTGVLPRSTAMFAVAGALSHMALLASLIVRDGFWSLEGPLIMLIPALLMAWIVATSIATLREPTAGTLQVATSA